VETPALLKKTFEFRSGPQFNFGRKIVNNFKKCNRTVSLELFSNTIQILVYIGVFSGIPAGALILFMNANPTYL